MNQRRSQTATTAHSPAETSSPISHCARRLSG